MFDVATMPDESMGNGHAPHGGSSIGNKGTSDCVSTPSKLSSAVVSLPHLECNKFIKRSHYGLHLNSLGELISACANNLKLSGMGKVT
jgi:hypothetical protein